MINITIGITVYNRKKTLERMIKSLFSSDINLDDVKCNIRVFDDCSDDFSEEDVRSMFPVEIDYYRHQKNRGADYNMGFMYRTFLETGDDYLFNCDSDLIFDRNWLNTTLRYIPDTDGVLSLFNTKNHPIIDDSGDLCIKKTVGNAGTVMSKQIVEMICNNIDVNETVDSLDWNWCGVLNENGLKVFCTNRSYVQHIGIYGFNSSRAAMDIGDCFHVDSEINGQILSDVLYDAVTQNNNDNNQRVFYYLFPFESVKPNHKVVIYGAGVVGRDYRDQLEKCDYCSELIQVDKKGTFYKNVYSPDVLKDLICDYVVIAANLLSVRNEMKKDILAINPLLENKIVNAPVRIVRL